MKLRVFTLVFVILIVGCSENKHLNSEDSNDMLTKEQIIEIANKALITHHLNMDKITVYYDTDNKEWTNYLRMLREEEAPAEFACFEKEYLEGRNIQAIHYSLGPNIIDGAYWLLIDKKTGEIIITIQD